jgi:hypothetical protein
VEKRGKRQAQHEGPCTRSGPPLAILLAGGEADDCPAERLIAKASQRLIGDKADDSAELRRGLKDRGTRPILPNRSNRRQPFSFSKRRGTTKTLSVD